jgi:hypothetical protein
MAKEDIYFQFPIRALNMEKSIDDVTEDEARFRFQQIIGYCLVEYGKVNFAKTGEEHGFQVASWYSKSEGCNTNCNPEIRQNAEVLFASQRLGVSLASDGAVLKKEHQLIVNLSGGNMGVRLRHDVFWSIASRELSWREWSILCGVYAMLANRPMVKLSYATINALALGYNGQKSIPVNLFENLRLTDRKTQTTVDRLGSRGFFSKVSPNRRHNYYSMKSAGELRQMLAHKEAARVIKLRESKAVEQTKCVRDLVAKIVEDEQKAKSRSGPFDVARK